MPRKCAFIIVFSLLVIGMLALAYRVQPVRSSPTTITVPDDYSTIQAAVDAANPGDTVYVRAGTYNGSIQIDKPLTLEGESNQNTTLRLQRPEVNDVVGLRVTASNVTISGFHLISPESVSDYVTLIDLDGTTAKADNCVIKDNVLEEYGADSLVLTSSRGDEVLGNMISSQDGSCVFMFYSSNCLLRNNSLSGSEWTGIYLFSSSNNIVSNNYITNQIDSIGANIGAITLNMYSEDNTVTGNTLMNNDYGVRCWYYTQNNVIYHNNFVNNTHQSYQDTSCSSIWDNGYPSGGNYWSDYNGTDLYSGPYQNQTGSDGIGDTPYVVDSNNQDNSPLMQPWTPSFAIYGITFAQSGVGSSFTGTVVTIDGSNYNVSTLPLSFWFDNGSIHTFSFQSPLVVGLGAKEYDWMSTTGLSSSQSGSITVTGLGRVTGNYVTRVHDVAVTSVVAVVPHCSSKVGNDSWVFQGLPVFVNVAVFNKGGFDENLTVTIYYNSTTSNSPKGINSPSIVLSPWQTQTIVLVWNTTAIPYCQNYTLTAVATILLDNNPADNTIGSGPINVRIMGDINGDGKVDGKDIALVGLSFGSCGPNYLCPGSAQSAKWNLDCDTNSDNKIDGKDLVLVAKNFGE